MEKHFVTFFSPGTFVAETTEKPVDSWDVEAARKMADEITERYGATPYGFRFTTRTRGPDDLDSKVSAKSPMYYINCKVQTLEFLEARNREDERILVSNMKSNGWDRVGDDARGRRTLCDPCTPPRESHRRITGQQNTPHSGTLSPPGRTPLRQQEGRPGRPGRPRPMLTTDLSQWGCSFSFDRRGVCVALNPNPSAKAENGGRTVARQRVR